jgi:hypothetical protein
LYGGGGATGLPNTTSNVIPGTQGAGGAVRIIWPGTTRQFPSTDVSTP